MSTEDIPRIVVGVDGEEAGRRALAWALCEAGAHGAVLEVVHAWSYEPLSDFAFTSSEQLHRESRDLLAREVAAVTEGKTGLPRIVSRSLQGAAAGTLVAAAADALLLVVGAHRGGLVREVVLGSVSGACVRHCARPVVVVPPHREVAAEPVSAAVPGTPLL